MLPLEGIVLAQLDDRLMETSLPISTICIGLHSLISIVSVCCLCRPSKLCWAISNKAQRPKRTRTAQSCLFLLDLLVPSSGGHGTAGLQLCCAAASMGQPAEEGSANAQVWRPPWLARLVAPPLVMTLLSHFITLIFLSPHKFADVARYLILMTLL
jgi:hypothetical protein